MAEAAAQQVPPEAELEAAIREALDGAALEDVTQRSLRTSLEARFGLDLTEQKARIKALTLKVIDERAAEAEEEEEEDDDGSSSGSESDSSDEEEEAKPKKKGGGGFNKEHAWSEDMTAFLGGSGYATRGEVTKALWAHIKKHDLQDPSDKRFILCDATLESLFGVKRVSGFKMAKYLGKHLRQDDRAAVKAEVKSEAESSDEEEDEDAKPKKKKAIKTEGKKAKGGGGDGGGGGGLNKELNWGADMAAFLGTDLMSRPQVVKALWAHIKGNKLQDPSDGRQINCDATLENLFGVKRVGAFQMAKYLKRHLVDEQGEPLHSGDTDDEEAGGKKRKAAAKGKAASKPKKNAKKAGGGDGEGPKRSFPPEKLSAELAALLGKPEAPRNEVVKALWAHIKEHKLQDPSDGRQINCDATLKGLFGVDRISGFGMNKFLGPHFKGRV